MTGSGKRRTHGVCSAEGGAEHDGAGVEALRRVDDRLDVAEIDAVRLVELRQLKQCAVHVDRLVPAALAQRRHHALRLAKRVGADNVRALGKHGDGGKQLADFVLGARMREHRQREGGFADEDVAGHDFERRAGGIGLALVVAADDDAAAVRLHRRLRRTQHVAGASAARMRAPPMSMRSPYFSACVEPAKPGPQRASMMASVSAVAMTAPWPGRA